MSSPITTPSRQAAIFFVAASLLTPSAQCPAQTFKAEGVVSIHNEASGSKTGFERPFTAFVHDGQWLIRTKELNSTNLVDYFESGYDGTNLTTLFHYRRKLRPEVYNTASVAVRQEVVPETGPSLITPVWLGLASRQYFRGLTNSSIEPIWGNPRRKQAAKYNPTGRWKFSEQAPGMLMEGSFYESGGIFPPPYEEGHLRTGFAVTSWTNVSGLMLPAAWHLQEYLPKTVKSGSIQVIAAANRDDARPWAKMEVRIASYEIGHRLNMYRVMNEGPVSINDMRFSKAVPPAPVVSYQATSFTNATPGTNSPAPVAAYRKAIKQPQRPMNSDRQGGRLVVFSIFVLITISFAVIVRQYNRQTNPKYENKT